MKTWLENKISRNIRLIFSAKTVLNKDSLTELYYSYICSYLSYVNMVWVSTHEIKLHKIHLKQKHAIRLICNENKFKHTKLLIRSLSHKSKYKISTEVLHFGTRYRTLYWERTLRNFSIYTLFFCKNQ